MIPPSQRSDHRSTPHLHKAQHHLRLIISSQQASGKIHQNSPPRTLPPLGQTTALNPYSHCVFLCWVVRSFRWVGKGPLIDYRLSIIPHTPNFTSCIYRLTFLSVPLSSSDLFPNRMRVADSRVELKSTTKVSPSHPPSVASHLVIVLFYGSHWMTTTTSCPVTYIHTPPSFSPIFFFLLISFLKWQSLT